MQMTPTEGKEGGDEGGQKYGAERQGEEGSDGGMMERVRGWKGKAEKGSE